MQDRRGQFTRQEILSQPDVWADVLQTVERRGSALRALWMEGDFDAVVFTGCGSTYYLSLAAASVLAQLSGVPARGVPASELLFYPESVLPANKRVLLVAVSRSGETTETQRAVRAFQQRATGAVLTLTCEPEKPLATMGDLNVVLAEAREQSVVQTRAFSALYLAAVAVAAVWAGREDLTRDLQALPAAGRRLLGDYLSWATHLAGDDTIEHCFFLGSGPRYGLACEVSLKMKEAALTASEPFHTLEFRHGPKSVVGANTLLVGLLSDQQAAAELEVLAEMRALGARTVSLGERGADVSFQSGLQEAARGVLYLPLLQWLAVERAMRRGLDPDNPRHLTAVVHLATAPA